MRFWASSSKLGNDLDYQEQDLISGKKLITKLINASNFVFMNLKDFDGKRPKEIERLDELFLEKLNYLISTITKRFESYDYSSSKNKIEQFFLKDFCDNYLEIVKKRVYSEEGNKRKSAQYVLYRILFAILKMFAPIMPFITEEIYQEHFRGFEKEKSIHVSGWPKKVDGFKESIVNDFDFFVDLLNKVRTEKTRMQKSMNADCIIYMPEKNKRALLKMLDDFKNVTNAKEIKESKEFKVEF